MFYINTTSSRKDYYLSKKNFLSPQLNLLTQNNFKKFITVKGIL